jgi:hypothetical protein
MKCACENGADEITQLLIETFAFGTGNDKFRVRVILCEEHHKIITNP